jgi:hypothetical protein
VDGVALYVSRPVSAQTDGLVARVAKSSGSAEAVIDDTSGFGDD